MKGRIEIIEHYLSKVKVGTGQLVAYDSQVKGRIEIIEHYLSKVKVGTGQLIA